MAAGIAVRSPAADWVIDLAGRAFHGNLLETVVEAKFTDNVGALSGELEIQVQDAEKHWQSDLFPAFGDNIYLEIGYADEGHLVCGFYQIDEIDLNGPPDVVHLHAIGSPVTQALKTRNTTAYEHTTLIDIANLISYKHGFKPITSAKLALNVSFARVTQYRETDLGFLRRIALDHGFDFKIVNIPDPPVDRSKPAPPYQLVFYSINALDAMTDAPGINRSDMTVLSFNFHYVSHLIYNACEVSYWDPGTKSLLTYRASDPNVPAAVANVQKLVDRCENIEQARVKAQSALRVNMLLATGSLTIIGSVIYSPGDNVQVTGFGRYSGRYRVNSTVHTLNRHKGYTTKLDLMQIPQAAPT